MVVRNLQEVRELKELLERITGFIADYGGEQYLDDPAFKYACDVADALAWVLGEIDTGKFTGPDYLNLDKLMTIVKEIEEKRGAKFGEYK
jgi:hypothetical protein